MLIHIPKEGSSGVSPAKVIVKTFALTGFRVIIFSSFKEFEELSSIAEIVDIASSNIESKDTLIMNKLVFMPIDNRTVIVFDEQYTPSDTVKDLIRKLDEIGVIVVLITQKCLC